MPVFKMIQPRNEIERLHDEVERFLGAGRECRERGRAAAHSVHLGQNDENFYVEALTAGLDPATLSITFEDDVLKVSGKRPDTPDAKRWIRQERQRGDLDFQLRVPKPVDAEKISADYQNGILLITLPKAATAKPRTIAVNAN